MADSTVLEALVAAKIDSTTIAPAERLRYSKEEIHTLFSAPKLGGNIFIGDCISMVWTASTGRSTTARYSVLVVDKSYRLRNLSIEDAAYVIENGKWPDDTPLSPEELRELDRRVAETIARPSAPK